MPPTYLDTSAAMKLLFREQESGALKAHLARRGEEPLVSSWLLHTECIALPDAVVSYPHRSCRSCCRS